MKKRFKGSEQHVNTLHVNWSLVPEADLHRPADPFQNRGHS
jgi:hypothetical protein